MKKHFIVYVYELRNRVVVCCLLFLALYQVACTNEREQELQYVNMENISETTDIKISDVLSDMEYIKLETTDDCLIGNKSKIFADDQHIFTIANKQIFVFNRKNGKFIRSISKAGDAPDEYSRVIRTLPVQEKERTISAYTSKGLIKYSYQGEAVLKVIKPLDTFFSEFVEVEPYKYAGYVFNMADKLILFDSLGVVTKRFPNHLMTPSDILLFPNCGFYEYEQTIHLYEALNDTVFALRADSLYPKYKLNLGKHRILLDQLGQAPSQEFYYIQDIYESNRHLFILYEYDTKRHLAVYDKKGGQTLYNSDGCHLVNDIDNFAPVTLSHISNNRFIGSIAADELVSWKEQNEAYMKNNPKLTYLLDTKEMDNPIVVIGRPK